MIFAHRLFLPCLLTAVPAMAVQIETAGRADRVGDAGQETASEATRTLGRLVTFCLWAKRPLQSVALAHPYGIGADLVRKLWIGLFFGLEVSAKLVGPTSLLI